MAQDERKENKSTVPGRSLRYLTIERALHHTESCDGVAMAIMESRRIFVFLSPATRGFLGRKEGNARTSVYDPPWDWIED